MKTLLPPALFRQLALLAVLALTLMFAARAHSDDFAMTMDAARGQTVFFNAWGGDDKINDYIAWAGSVLQARHGITLKHVKLADTGNAVSRILAEKAAGRTTGGSVDLLWVNGENFAAMKVNGLLQDAPWAEQLPSWRFTDAEALPAIRLDFAEPTEGRESPWGRAQLVFSHDSRTLPRPPRNARALAEFIRANPGRFTYPQPPDFIGLSFLKQILLETAMDTTPLYRPVGESDFDAVTAPLWNWLAAVTPNLWRGGKAYPFNYPTLRQLLGDGEVDISIAFNPADASAAISRGELPDSVRSYIHDDGTLANVHFLAIPFNANAPEAARVVANFMLSPEAQLRKADPRVWGDPTVLAMHLLTPEDRAKFNGLPRGVATLSEAELTTTLAEPHPSWMKAIEVEWRRRFGTGG
ncbi:MAG: ABC transporter substrate-binding protein [Candidatus Puniceispirillaceae bacterium]